ncbi:hypothetical protein TrVE_jg14064 [Triparma verrucosa]|uniref:3-oxo-5-alpha-steroid 4-dehydrogenase C-terminal domain-containing protein n=1 Tax=Triparma verrucosa TaxID=1606542 RepID=A0A9W7BSQ2_9STRA|nr:hypothetical protein TrVE_jg14064 [Triparma verrucosa]
MLIPSLAPTIAPAIAPFVLPPNLAFSAIAAVQISSIFAGSGDTQAPYSKFALGQKLDAPIPSKLGMLIIYSPAAAYALYALLQDSWTISSPTLIPLLLIHFAKRLFETVFVHKYSGSTSLPLASGIGTYYVLMSALIVATSASTIDPTLQTLGLSLFAIGAAGNFYHHVLLSNLRKNKKEDDKYVMPSSGLFKYSAAPHYLFELIGWLGIGLTSQSVNGLLVFLWMASYLSERARAQNEWNASKFENWVNKKNMIPGVW